MFTQSGRGIPVRIWSKRLLTATACSVLAIGAAYAKGGTAKPPAPGTGTPPVIATPPPVAPPVVFSTAPANIHGFDITGFIQDATVSSASCPGLPESQWGGTVTVNSLTVTVPCNTTMQMPAATFTWSDLFNPTKFTSVGPVADFKLKTSSGTPLPSMEISVVGNIVNGVYIAGLITLSQQSLNGSLAYIVDFDYANGAMLVGPSPAGPATTRVQINDPDGRFSQGQSPDTRFAVDSENPTIKAGTGYPMCIPRVDPATGDDDKCPKRNRPIADGITGNGLGCRNFRDALIVLPTGRELAPGVAGQPCRAFVMPNPALATATQPTAFAQVPFAKGDAVNFSGTLLRGSADGPGGSDTISAHTIEANVGVFTQPGTLPAYIAIGEFGVGADAPATFNGVAQEAQNRIFLEAGTTDVTSIVDIYLMDTDPSPIGKNPDGTAKIINRWITPATMTGGTGAVGSNGALIDGGITTQFVGPQPGRARIRAAKATPGILVSPTRYIRVVLRSLCDPANINSPAVQVVGAAPGVTAPCLERAPGANGLFTGQYLAPVFEYIFPENVTLGDPLVAYNFWDLTFLATGEGPGTGPLTPKPW